MSQNATTSDYRTLEGADALYTSAALAELAADFDKAFSSYLSAAQTYLHLANTLPTTRARDRDRCRSSARTSLERAERIKEAKKDVLKPLARDIFSEAEQNFVLGKSTKIHGMAFPVWTGYDGESVGVPEPPGLLPLGPLAESLSPVWRRPRDVWPADKLALASPALQPHDIRQNTVADCSVCTAVAIFLDHHRKFVSKLGLKCLYPQDNDGTPTFASNGRYLFRFFVNGAFRTISIDDLLPFYTDDRPISASAAHIPGGFDVWPSLVEKAYMKLMGGYDFPGSNSSIDVQSPAFVREKVWRRIKAGFQLGSCLVTLGTGVRGSSLSVWSTSDLEVKLLPTHSYAVLDVCEDSDGSERRVTFLDPWPSILGSNENASSLDVVDGLRKSSLVDAVTQAESQMSAHGLVQVSWDDVCDVFDGIYLNWDPSLFRNTIEFHGIWIKKKNEDGEAPGCVHQHLTLTLSSAKDKKPGEADQPEQLWILLTRHFVDKRRSGEFINMHASEVEPHEAGGQPAADGVANPTLKATYTSSTHVLVRLTLSSSEAQVAIVASYEGPYPDVCYTVQAFSLRASLAWVKQPRTSAYERVLEGNLTARNAGGNSTFPTFMNNPQYKLHVHSDSERLSTSSSPISPLNSRRTSSQSNVLERKKRQKSHLRVVVEGPRNVPFSVTVLWRNQKESGERVLELTDNDVVSTSGAYAYGVAQTSASIMPGDYCIIISAFEPRHRGSFTLRIESSARFDVEAIPPEGAGMFCKIIEDAWTFGKDVGSPQFGNYEKNPTYSIDVRKSTVLKMRLQLTKSSPSIALNVSLFTSSSSSSPDETPAGPGRLISTSGAYVDSPAGTATPLATLTPGRYHAVVSTFDPGTRAQFRLLVYASTDVEIRPLSADGERRTYAAVQGLPDG